MLNLVGQLVLNKNRVVAQTRMLEGLDIEQEKIDLVIARQQVADPVESTRLEDLAVRIDRRQRLAQGIEQNRLALLLAVLQRHGGLAIGPEDVFVNVVGGVKVLEPATDLAVALALASTEGVDELTEEHWKLVNYLRDYYLKFGIAPMIRKLCKETGFPLKKVYELFPSGPAKGACKVAGLAKPTGCV